MAIVSRRFALLGLVALPACSGGVNDVNSRGFATAPGATDVAGLRALPGSPPPGTEADIAELTAAILALGPGVDPAEAGRAARVSYEYTYRLALEYQITDPALVHNFKVNRGWKPRGLCKHWAEDMERRLLAENFQTLQIHRAIGALVGVDHSTAIISRRGDSMYDGIVVDPWRRGGRLTWIRTDIDTAWGWEPQFKVLDEQARRVASEQGLDRIVYRVENKPARCLVVADDPSFSGGITSTTDMTRCARTPGSGSVSQPLGIEDFVQNYL